MNTFTAQDCNYLLDTLENGSLEAKSDSLKNILTIIQNEKQILRNYVKRLMPLVIPYVNEQQYELNYLVSQTILEVMQIVPNESQSFIVQILPQIVLNLGDDRANTRKNTHSCLLNFIRIYQLFDPVIHAFCQNGFNNAKWVIRQKSINSFQSLVLAEGKLISWQSIDFKNSLEQLIDKLEESNQNVMRAAEQALISVCKIQGFGHIGRKLSPDFVQKLINFTEPLKISGILAPEFTIDGNFYQAKQQNPIQKLNSQHLSTENSVGSPVKIQQNNGIQQQQQIVSTSTNITQFSSIGQNITNNLRVQSLGQTNSSNFVVEQQNLNVVNNVPLNNQGNDILNQVVQLNQNLNGINNLTNNNNGNINQLVKKENSQHSLQQQQQQQQQNQQQLSPSKLPVQQNFNGLNRILIGSSVQINRSNNSPLKIDKIDSARPLDPNLQFGFLPQNIYQNLVNEEDWKARAQAIEDVYNILHNSNIRDIESYAFEFTELLLQLFNDQNFKISLTAMNILNRIISLQAFNQIKMLDMIIPKIIEKLSDGKVAIRQAASQLIIDHFKTFKRTQWIEFFLKAIKDKNQHIKEEILNLLIIFYSSEEYIPFNYEKLLNEVAPLMEDTKTKIKIKSLECLVAITLKNNKEQCKGYLSQKLNQVYYDMYLEKLNIGIQQFQDLKKFPQEKFNQQKQLQNQQQFHFATQESMKHTESNSINPITMKERSFSRNSTSNRNLSPKQADQNPLLNKSNSKQQYIFEEQPASSSQSFGIKQENSKQQSDQMLDSRISNANTMNTTGNSMIKSNAKNFQNQNAGNYLFELSSTSSSRQSTVRPQSLLHSDKHQKTLLGNGINNNISGVDQLKLSRQQNLLYHATTGGQVNSSRIQSAQNTLDINKNDDNIKNSHEKRSSSAFQKNLEKFHSPIKAFPNQNNNYSLNQFQDRTFIQNQQNEQNNNNNININQQGYNPSQFQQYQANQENLISKRKISCNKDLIDTNNNHITIDLQNQDELNYEQTAHFQKQQTNENQQHVVKNNQVYLPLNSVKPTENDNDNSYLQYNKQTVNLKKQQNKKIEKEYIPSVVLINNNSSNNYNHKMEADNLVNANNNESLEILSKEYQNKNQQQIGDTNENSPQNLNFNNNSNQTQSNNQQSQIKKNVFKISQPKPAIYKKVGSLDDNLIDNENSQFFQEELKSVDRINNKNNSNKKKVQNKINGEGQNNIDYKQQVYLKQDELNPVINQESEYKNVLLDLKCDDWEQQFEALNNLRRLIKHHGTFLLNQNNFHQILLEVLKQVENLRSSLSKNAMITLQEMAFPLKKFVDIDLEIIIGKLLKKGLDTNSFISQEVKEALIAICQASSSNKLIPILIGLSNQKAVPQKLNVLLCLESIIEKQGKQIMQIKEIEKFLQFLTNFMFDNAVEVRNNAKKTFSIFLINSISIQEVEKLLQKLLNEQNYLKIKTYIEKEHVYVANNISQMSSESSPVNHFKIKKYSSEQSSNARQQSLNNTFLSNRQKISEFTLTQEDEINESNQTQYKSKKSPQTTMNKSGFNVKAPQEFDNLTILYNQSENSDWNQRNIAVNQLSEIAQQYPEHINRNKYSNKFLDVFMKLLTDSNVKVQLNALNCFNDLIFKLSPGIYGNILVVCNSLFQCIGSNNGQVKQIAEKCYDVLRETTDTQILYPITCNAVIYQIAKCRLYLLSVLEEYTECCHSEKGSAFIAKPICNTITKLLQENKPDYKQQTQQLIIKVKQLIGNEIFENTEKNVQDKIQEIIKLQK